MPRACWVRKLDSPLETRWGPTSHLVVVGVVQIFIVIIRSLAFLHLVPHGPLAGRCMAVIHGVICIPGRPNV